MLLKWGLPGREINSAKVPPAPRTSTTPGCARHAQSRHRACRTSNAACSDKLAQRVCSVVGPLSDAIRNSARKASAACGPLPSSGGRGSRELARYDVVAGHARRVAVDDDRRRRLQQLGRRLVEVRGGDALDLLHELRGRRPRAIGEHLPPDVLEEDGSALEVHEEGRLELVLRARELEVGDGAGHLAHLVAERGDQVAHVLGGRGAVDAEETRVVVEGVEDGRALREAVPVEDVLVEPRVHALARPARGEGGAAAHERVEHAQRHQRRVLPADALEGEREMRDRLVRGLAHLAARVRARGAVRRRAAGRLAEGGLREADQLGVVVARRGEHHPVGHHVVRRELLQHGGRDGGEVAGRAHGRLAERRASAVGRGVAHLLQERLRVLLQLLELSLHRGVRLLDLPREELGRESRLRQQTDQLRHRALQRVDLIDGVLTRRERGDRRPQGLAHRHHLELRHGAGALERHVLNQVGGARDLIEGASRFDVEANRGSRGGEVRRRHLQAVLQGRDLQRGRARAPRRSVRSSGSYTRATPEQTGPGRGAGGGGQGRE
eukprot:scaffold122739_cov63-Phaeocystis_antarctica.AAC.1